ncbi:MAG TPA: hypothetical protein PLW12_08950 [Methanothrix sp.]|nr:hypothetical protein [Methanothrix sp.]
MSQLRYYLYAGFGLAFLVAAFALFVTGMWVLGIVAGIFGLVKLAHANDVSRGDYKPPGSLTNLPANKLSARMWACALVGGLFMLTAAMTLAGGDVGTAAMAFVFGGAILLYGAECWFVLADRSGVATATGAKPTYALQMDLSGPSKPSLSKDMRSNPEPVQSDESGK